LPKHGISQLKTNDSTFADNKSTLNSMYFYCDLIYNIVCVQLLIKKMSNLKKPVYSKDHAVFQNKIVDLYRGMSLDEKRMLVLLSPIVRTTGVREGESVFLSASEYAKECNISPTRAYEGLASASEKLVRRYFSYIPEPGKKTVANWILRSTYSEGGVDVCFTNEVLTMLQMFDKYNPYTKYKKEIVLQLKGDYSFEIYHIAKQYEGIGKADVLLEDLKENLAVPNSYHDLSNLKKRVLEPSCEEVSKNTDIILTYETVKRGRSVIAIRFIIKNKSTENSKVKRVKDHLKDPNTPDLFTQLTPFEVNLYAKKLAYDSEFGSKYLEPGEDYAQAEEKLRVQLSQQEYVQKYSKYLKKLKASAFKKP
jgi:plasmid replication initiation protein